MGGITLAVNCAGIATAGRALGREGPWPSENFNRVIQVNLVGTFNVTKEAAAFMSQNDPSEEGERGVIISTASIAAFEGQIGQAAYSASKGGVVGMMLPLAREFAQFGIRVNTIAPGVFLTPMVAGMPEEVQESLGRQVPFPPRLGAPEEFCVLPAGFPDALHAAFPPTNARHARHKTDAATVIDAAGRRSLLKGFIHRTRDTLLVPPKKNAARQSQTGTYGKQVPGTQVIKQGAVDHKADHQPQPVRDGIVGRLPQGFGRTGGKPIHIEDAGHVEHPIGDGVQDLRGNDDRRCGSIK